MQNKILTLVIDQTCSDAFRRTCVCFNAVAYMLNGV